MGIGINGDTKQDYSYLFQNLSSGSGGMGDLNFLSDYASIKNGSYGRLLKSYYKAEQSSATTSNTKSRSSNVLDKILREKMYPKVSKETEEANSKLLSGLSTMKSSVAALQDEKTYVNTENGQSAATKVVSAMKDYVSNYNDIVKASKGSTLTNKTAYVANVMSSTAANADKLSEIGVTVNKDGTLTLDEDKLKTADISKVQELFSPKDIMSYGSIVNSRLHFANVTSGTNAADSTGTTGNSAAAVTTDLKTDAKTLASDKLYAMIQDKDGNEKYDIDKIFATAKSFVKNYNKMFDNAESSSNSGVVANLLYIREKTAQNTDTLKQFGISVNEKGRMTIDEDTFKKADMSQVQKFFQDYGSSIATNASLVDYYMTTNANAASGYTASGTYNVPNSSGYSDIM